MPENEPNEGVEGGKVDEPEPNPWAGSLQLASIATAGTSVCLLVGDSSNGSNGGGYDPETLAWLPDPNQVFAGVAQVLGFQFRPSDAWSWGIALAIVSLVLNILSYALYRRDHKAREKWTLAARSATAPRAQSQAQTGGMRRDA